MSTGRLVFSLLALAIFAGGCGDSGLCNAHKKLQNASIPSDEAKRAREDIAKEVKIALSHIGYARLVGEELKEIPELRCPACDKLIDRYMRLSPK
jgi:hypothetical protein